MSSNAKQKIHEGALSPFLQLGDFVHQLESGEAFGYYVLIEGKPAANKDNTKLQMKGKVNILGLGGKKYAAHMWRSAIMGATVNKEGNKLLKTSELAEGKAEMEIELKVDFSQTKEELLEKLGISDNANGDVEDGA
jgi:hypothetical protein